LKIKYAVTIRGLRKEERRCYFYLINSRILRWVEYVMLLAEVRNKSDIVVEKPQPKRYFGRAVFI